MITATCRWAVLVNAKSAHAAKKVVDQIDTRLKQPIADWSVTPYPDRVGCYRVTAKVDWQTSSISDGILEWLCVLGALAGTWEIMVPHNYTDVTEMAAHIDNGFTVPGVVFADCSASFPNKGLHLDSTLPPERKPEAGPVAKEIAASIAPAQRASAGATTRTHRVK